MRLFRRPSFTRLYLRSVAQRWINIPQNPVATADDSDSVTITWDPVEGAVGYDIARVEAGAPGLAVPVVESVYTGDTEGNNTTCVIAKPSGTVEGDLLVACWYAEENLTVTPPTDWVLVEEVVDSGAGPGTTTSAHVYWKAAGASEPSDYTWSWSGADWNAGGMLRISGADNAAPIHASVTRTKNAGGTNSDGDNGGSSTVQIPAITTTIDNCLGVAFIATWTTLCEAASVTGWTGQAGFDYGRVLTKDLPTAGAVSQADASVTDSLSWATVTLAIKPAPHVVATDDFNRSNGGLGANWTTVYQDPTIVSNQVKASVYDNCYAFWNGGTFDDDQWAEVDAIFPTAGTTIDGGVTVRTGSGGTGYLLTWLHASGGSNYYLYRMSSLASWTQIGTASATGAGTRRLRLEVIGSSLKAYVDGIEVISTTDANYSTGRPGIEMYRGDTTEPVLDNFSAGDWGGSDTYTVIATDVATTSYNDTGLDASTEYSYAVRAVF